jgi:hypothetical protein
LRSYLVSATGICNWGNAESTPRTPPKPDYLAYLGQFGLNTKTSDGVWGASATEHLILVRLTIGLNNFEKLTTLTMDWANHLDMLLRSTARPKRLQALGHNLAGTFHSHTFAANFAPDLTPIAQAWEVEIQSNTGTGSHATAGGVGVIRRGFILKEFPAAQ